MLETPKQKDFLEVKNQIKKSRKRNTFHCSAFETSKRQRVIQEKIHLPEKNKKI